MPGQAGRQRRLALIALLPRTGTASGRASRTLVSRGLGYAESRERRGLEGLLMRQFWHRGVGVVGLAWASWEDGAVCICRVRDVFDKVTERCFPEKCVGTIADDGSRRKHALISAPFICGDSDDLFWAISHPFEK